jgi:tetratricopeptide (TPR) repeat protein/predicted Ser/Thr protein kinase
LVPICGACYRTGSAPAATVTCPDDSTLVAMIEHALDPASFHSLEIHLDSCDRCRVVAAVAISSRSFDAGAPTHGFVVEPADPEGLVGTTIQGRYSVGSLLGRGGMGTVYRARDLTLDRDIALKVHRLGADNARLQREAVAMAQLAHPNVVNVFEVGTVDTWMYVAMEYVRGATLREWIAAAPRGWREILTLLGDAGRGLAAAHASGLVHRDFKPDNVLVGDDGRPRVSDFGLARVDDTTTSESRAASTSCEMALTVTGTLLGTPAYMAPEQFAGGAVDARCDQFAFCVVAWECLHGQRPFAGATIAAIQLAIEGHELQRPVGRTAVPPEVIRVLERGLAAAPGERYPDMPTLLAELRRAASPRSKRRLVIAGVVALAAIGIAIPVRAVIGERRRVAACDDQGEAIRRELDAGTRSSIERAFLATDLPIARSAFDHTIAVLARHTEALATETAAACRAEVDPARRACLAGNRSELAGVVDSLASADAGLVQRAPDVAWGMFDPSPCDDDILAAPTAASTPARVADLGRMKALARAGAYREGIAAAAPLLEDARATSDRGLEYAVLFELGQMQQEVDPPHKVVPVFHQAHAVAESLGRDLDAAAALEALANVAGVDQNDYAAAHRYLDLARAKLERLGGGNLLLEAKVLMTEAQTLADENRLAEAEPIQRRAIALLEQSHGVDHPSVGAVHGTLSQILRGEGKLAEALAESERALAILDHALGPDHPTTAGASMTLGQSLIDAGRFDEARTRLLAADEVFVRVYGPDHPVRAGIHGNLGLLEQARERWDAALPAFRVALGILEKSEGPGSPSAAGARRDIALTLAGSGQLDEAVAEAERSLAILDELGPEGAPQLAGVLTDLARIQLARSRPLLALPIAERALGTVLAQGESAPPDELSAARFAVARALWDAHGDRARARTLAEQALTGAPAGATRDEIDAWLAAHPTGVATR